MEFSKQDQADCAMYCAKWLHDLSAIVKEAQKRHDSGDLSLQVYKFINNALWWVVQRGHGDPLQKEHEHLFGPPKDLKDILTWLKGGG